MARNSSMMVAKDTICITVGARPIQYKRATVWDRRRSEPVEIDIHEAEPIDPGDDGISYTFRAGQKVPRSHDAVKACPDAFLPLEDADHLDVIE